MPDFIKSFFFNLDSIFGAIMLTLMVLIGVIYVIGTIYTTAKSKMRRKQDRP